MTRPQSGPGLRRVFTTRSSEETIALGHTLLGLLPLPATLVLRGDLGAGKTTLVKGIAAALGAAEPDEVTSPTFTLIHEYAGRNLAGDGVLLLYHLDVYRIETQRQLDTLGIEELATPRSLVLIEWGEKFPSILARSDGEILIETLPGDERRITLYLWGSERAETAEGILG